jgi:alkylhydroperoxidase/carboxymuconolactone decarboxylase family protein YurZ
MEESREAGMRVRREVLGDAHVDHAGAAAGALGADFQDWITRCAWGEVWARPGLDRRTRSCITVAMICGRLPASRLRRMERSRE